MARQDVKITIKAIDKTKKVFSGITGSLRRVAGSVLSMKTAIGGVVGAAGLGLLVKQSLDATDALAKTAKRIGTTTESLSRLRYAADLTGVSTETMQMAMQRFTRRTAEAARGTGEARGALRELNLGADDLLQLPLEEQMVKLADAFQDVGTDADKVRLAMKLFDSEGVALVQTLGEGAEGLRQMFDEAEMLGAVMSSDAAKGVEDAKDEFTRLSAVMGGLRDLIVAGLAPALESIVKSLTDMIKEAAKTEGGFRNLASSIAASMVGAFITVIKGSENMVNGVIEGINMIRRGIREFQKASGIGPIGRQAELLEQQEQLNKRIADGTAQINKMRDAVREGQGTFGVGTTVDAIVGDRERLEGVNEELERLAPQIEALTDIPKLDIEALTGGMLSGLEELQERLAKGFELGETEGKGGGSVKGIGALTLALEGARKAAKDFNDINDDIKSKMESITKDTMASFSKALTDAAMGTGKLKDAFKAMIVQMIRDLIQFAIIDKLTGGIASALFSVKKVASGGSSKPSSSSIPGRAIGGPVQAGSPYMVGERGPEMFIPNSSGSIVPNDKLGGGITVVNNVDASGAGQDVDVKIRAAMQQASQQTVLSIQDLMRRKRFA